MLIFIVFGLFLILMTLYTYFYVSANSAALILIALIIYVPYFILKTFETVDFKSQIAELLAGKKIFRDFLKKSNFFGLMRTLYQAVPKLLKLGEDFEDTSFITALNMVVMSIRSVIGTELPAELEKAKTRTYSLLYDKNLLNFGSQAHLAEPMQDGFGSVVLDYGYDLAKPFSYAIDLENRIVSLYQEKLGSLVAVLQFNETKWRQLRENQTVVLKETHER